MKRVIISYHASPDHLAIRVSGDILEGNVLRSEGSRSMTLIEPEAVFTGGGIDYSLLHGDLIALIGILCFHPSLPTEPFKLHFDFSVSEAVEFALCQPFIVPTAHVSAEGRSQRYTPSRDSVLSYGGGFDSLAAHLIFPDVPLVHETPLGEYEDVVVDILPSLTKSHHVVRDNVRSLYSVWGLPLWVTVYAASLIMSPKIIISGSEMTGTYLNGGKGYLPRYQNRWYNVFKKIGVEVLPTSFLSEVGNARVVHHHHRIDSAAYCTFIRNKDCNKCTKCLRRRQLRAMLDENASELVEGFERTPKIIDFLKTRPLYYGDIFTHAFNSAPRKTWLSEFLSDLSARHGRITFHERYNPETFAHFNFPKSISEQAIDGMASAGIEPFSLADFERFRNFQQVAG